MVILENKGPFFPLIADHVVKGVGQVISVYHFEFFFLNFELLY